LISSNVSVKLLIPTHFGKEFLLCPSIISETNFNKEHATLLNPIIDEIKKEFKDSGRGEEFEDFLNELYGKFNYDPLNPEKSKKNRKKFQGL